MYSTWEYAPANEAHAFHICQVIKGMGYDVTLTQRLTDEVLVSN